MTYLNLLRITVESREDARVIRVAGEIDGSTVAELREHIDAARDAQTTVLLDLADVGFMDSTGLRVLLDASRDAADANRPFFIVRPSAIVQRLIELSGTAAELPLVETDARVLR